MCHMCFFPFFAVQAFSLGDSVYSASLRAPGDKVLRMTFSTASHSRSHLYSEVGVFLLRGPTLSQSHTQTGIG